MRTFNFSAISTNTLKERLSTLMLLVGCYANYDTKKETDLIAAIQKELDKRVKNKTITNILSEA